MTPADASAGQSSLAAQSWGSTDATFLTGVAALADTDGNTLALMQSAPVATEHELKTKQVELCFLAFTSVNGWPAQVDAAPLVLPIHQCWAVTR